MTQSCRKKQRTQTHIHNWEKPKSKKCMVKPHLSFLWQLPPAPLLQLLSGPVTSLWQWSLIWKLFWWTERNSSWWRPRVSQPPRLLRAPPQVRWYWHNRLSLSRPCWVEVREYGWLIKTFPSWHLRVRKRYLTKQWKFNNRRDIKHLSERNCDLKQNRTQAKASFSGIALPMHVVWSVLFRVVAPGTTFSLAKTIPSVNDFLFYASRTRRRPLTRSPKCGRGADTNGNTSWPSTTVHLLNTQMSCQVYSPQIFHRIRAHGP